jgi:hypothetical protein
VAAHLMDGNASDQSSLAHALPPVATRPRSLWELFAYTPLEEYRTVRTHPNVTKCEIKLSSH